MKIIHYDPKTDAIYIEIAKGKYEVSKELSGSVIVDEDKNGKVLGIEILDVSKVLGPKFRENMKKSNVKITPAVAHKISK